MGLIESLRRWLLTRPPERPPSAHPRPSRRQEDEDEEIAELLAIEII